MARTKKQYPENAKTVFGVATMPIAQVIAMGMISGTLMLYLTDYANLFAGQAGAAAAAATTLLVAGRVWDAVNDPILGFVMDRSPRTRWGRFKPFAMVAIPVSGIVLIVMFNLPKDMPDTTKLGVLYALYFIFDACFTLMPFAPITQSLTPHARIRSKLIAVQRAVTLFFAALASAFMAVAIALGSPAAPNLGLAAIAFFVPAAIVSMVGLALVKEGDANSDEEVVRLRDVVTMVTQNKPLWISQLSGFFYGFVWNFIYVAAAYYVKYAFGAENFGLTMALVGLSIIAGNMLGIVAVQLLLKRTTPAQAFLITALVTAIPMAILYVLNLAGPITSIPLFFSLVFLATLAIGATYVPGTLVTMECMDYNKFKVGKSMEGTLNSTVGFIQKLQGALAAAVTGAILVAVGYDATRYADATAIPPELFGGLGLVMFGLPAVLSVIAAIAMLPYPLRKAGDRALVYAAIQRHQESVAAEADATATPESSR